MSDDGVPPLGWKQRMIRVGLALLGIVAFLAFAIVLERDADIPVKIMIRLAVAAICLYFTWSALADYRGERWPYIAFAVAVIVSVGLFFSPFANLPASKGDILFFAAPDAAIVLGARAITYPATNDHERAIRQQLIVGLILALAFTALILSMMWLPDHRTPHDR